MALRANFAESIAVLLLITLAGAFIAAPGCGPAETQQPTRSAATHETVEPAGDRVVRYELKQAGQVSAAVYDAEGRLIRELLRGEPQDAGSHTIEWDGLNRAGEPMPTGDYTFRVLRTPGFTAHYVTSIGINPGSAPYEKWVGNHGGAASVAVDETGMYAAAQVTETAPVLLKQSLDGKTRHWTRGRGDVTRGRFQGGASLAADGEGRLYMLQQNGYLQVIDAAEGRPTATWDVLTQDKKRKSDGGPTFFIYQHGKRVAGADLAARGETIVVSYREHEMVRWLNPEDGAIAAEVKVDSPTGVAVGVDGTVYVISGEQVLTVTPDGRKQTVIAEGLTAPRRLCVAPANGDLLIAERDPSHQMKRYSAAGEHQATWGRAGGRLDGHYKPQNFRGITDIAADGHGGFFVAELTPAPRRVAHFDADGELIDEWYGGQPYYAWGEPDPRDPSKVWFNPGHWLTLAEVDYDNGGWRVLENYEIETLAGGMVHSLPGHAGRWRVLYRGDQRYLLSTRDPQVLAHGHGTLRAVSVIGNGKAATKAAALAGHDGPAGAFRWVDLNDDGEPQPDEFTFSESRHVPGGTWVADDFGALRAGNHETEDGQIVFRVHRTLPVWAEGRPIYPIGDEPGLNEIAAAAPIAGRTGSRGTAVYQSAAGDFYAHYNTGDERHGASWPTYWGQISRVARWADTGDLRWKVGRHAIHGGLGGSPHTTPPGRMHVPDGIIGEADDVIVVADRVENLAAAWTIDGLYAGSFFDHRAEDGLPDAVYYWWRTPDGTEAITTSDNGASGRVFQRDDGAVLWFVQGRNSVPTYTVTGWDGWERVSGTLRIDHTPAHAAAGGTGLAAQYFDRPDIAGEPIASRVETQVWHGAPRRQPGNDSVVDGFHVGPRYNWSKRVEPVEKPTDFAVRWTGEFEAPLSESFKFSVYARGGARLWIDGEQVIFAWNECTTRWESEHIPLEAGRRYAVQLDFYATQAHPACSLNWESNNVDRQRLPTRYLYPQTDAPVATEPDARPARNRILARTFDDQSGDIPPGRVRGSVSGLRQRGLGVSGSWLAYRRLDFGDGADRLRLHARGRPAGDGDYPVTLEFRLDAPDGPVITAIDVREGEAGPITAAVQDLAGVHDIYVVNTTAKHWHFIYFNAFQFE